MKYVMTFENYQTYNDYQRGSSKWGTPEELKQDATITLKRSLPTFDEKWIDSVEDQSDDKKGIKFEFKIGVDVVHMFKIGNWRGQWEFYLNKKKISDRDLKKSLEEKHLSKIDAFLKYAYGYDFYTDYIDDGSQYNAANANNRSIEDMFKSLSGSDKKKATKELYKKFDKTNVDRVFKS